ESDGTLASGWPKLWPAVPDGQSYGVVAQVFNTGAVFVVGSYMPEGTGTPNTVVLKYLDDGTLLFASEFDTTGQCGGNVPITSSLSGSGSLWVACASPGCSPSNYSIDYLIWGLEVNYGTTLDIVRYDHGGYSDIPTDIKASGVPLSEYGGGTVPVIVVTGRS